VDANSDNSLPASSHQQVADVLGRITKYVYDNPESGRAVLVLNCSHEFVQAFTDGQAEVKATIDFVQKPECENPTMRLSVVVLFRSEQEPQPSDTGDEIEFYA